MHTNTLFHRTTSPLLVCMGGGSEEDEREKKNLLTNERKTKKERCLHTKRRMALLVKEDYFDRLDEEVIGAMMDTAFDILKEEFAAVGVEGQTKKRAEDLLRVMYQGAIAEKVPESHKIFVEGTESSSKFDEKRIGFFNENDEYGELSLTQVRKKCANVDYRPERVGEEEYEQAINDILGEGWLRERLEKSG